MSPGLRPAPSATWAAILVLLLTSGCGSSRDDGGFALPAMRGWHRVKTAAHAVPGKPLAAWSGPEGSSLVAYRTLPVPRARPEGLAEEYATRLSNLPGLRIVTRKKIEIGGQGAAYIEAIAPGTGDAWAPSGTGTPFVAEGRKLISTHRLCVGIPRSGDTLWLVWHYPEESRDRITPQVETCLKGLTIRARALSRSSY